MPGPQFPVSRERDGFTETRTVKGVRDRVSRKYPWDQLLSDLKLLHPDEIPEDAKIQAVPGESPEQDSLVGVEIYWFENEKLEEA